MSDDGFYGDVRTDYFRSDRLLDSQTNFDGITADLGVHHAITSGLDGKVHLRVMNDEVNRQGDTDWKPIEAYVTAHFTTSDLRVGRQVVAWGRADGINPTDNLTPTDETLLLPTRKDQRLGTPSLKWDRYIGASDTVTIFATPFFEPSIVPVVVPPGMQSTTASLPAHTWSQTEVAAKFDHTGGGMDWSVSYFRGDSLTPDARLAGYSGAIPLIQNYYAPLDVLGADFARNAGQIGVRGEVAYLYPRAVSAQDPASRKPEIFAVLGGDRLVLTHAHVDAQLFAHVVEHYSNPMQVGDPVVRALAVQNAIFDGEDRALGLGWTLRVGESWRHETLTGNVLVVENLTPASYLIRPRLSYAFTDHIQGSIGADIYKGPPDSLFGALTANDNVFVELMVAM